MAYMPELLSEQIAITNLTGALTTAGTLTRTGGAADLRENHRFRVRAMWVDNSTKTAKTVGAGTTKTATATATATVTGVLKVQAATNTKFVGATNLTTITTTIKTVVTATAKIKTGTTTATATAIAIDSVSYEATGEILQAVRLPEDRYLRAILTVKGGAGACWVEEDCSRYKPNP